MKDYSKDMYRQMEELFAKVESLTAKVNEQAEEIQTLRIEVKEKEKTIRRLEKKVGTFEATVEKKNEEIHRLQATVNVLTHANTVLKEENARLKSQLQNNSDNSSNPPSGDQKGGKSANRYNGRKKTEKKQGAQPGHKGTTLTKAKAEELIASGQCKHTIREIGDPKSGRCITKYEIDIHIEPEVIEYRIYDRKSVPAHLRSDVTYGVKVKAFAAELYGIGIVSIDRIQEIISSITKGSLNISAGTIYGFCRKLSVQAQASLNEIEEHILNGEVAYTDATVVTVDGKLCFVRNVSNKDAVRYYGMDKKNLASMKKLRLLTKFAGIFIHDHETSLYHFGMEHGECNAHLLRYLLKNTEDCGTTWSVKLRELLYEMKSRRDEAVESGFKELSESELSAFMRRYDEILQLGRKENETTQPKWAKQEENALLNRLEKYKANHLLFLKRFDVAFTNNMSERDLRKCKNRQKLSGGFRTLEGCEMFADILSIIETAKRMNLSVFDTISSLFQSPAPVFVF